MEGGEGGGFRTPGTWPALVLLPLVRSKTTVPISVAARWLRRRTVHGSSIALGAEGIQMGTRIVSAAESPVHANLKQAIVDATETDTLFLNRFSKLGLRAIRTERSIRLDCEEHVPILEMAHIRDVYFGGDMEAAPALVGQVIRRIRPPRRRDHRRDHAGVLGHGAPPRR